MQILALYEKNVTRIFQPDEDGTFLSTYAFIIEERLDDGNWYMDKDEEVADNLTEEFRLLNDEETFNGKSSELDAKFEVLQEKMYKFLMKRRIYEYGEWDILDTEN